MFRKAGLLFAAVLLAGCAHARYQTIELPPVVNLAAYRSVGIIEFSSAGQAVLGPLATQAFMHQIQRAQPGTRFVELGTRQRVLSSLGRQELDIEAIKQIGTRYGVDLLISGAAEVSPVRPDFRLTTGFTSVNAQASVMISVNAKLWETANAATVWTNGAGRECSLVQVGFNSKGKSSVGVNDPETEYGKTTTGLIHSLMDDFQPRYIKKRIE